MKETVRMTKQNVSDPIYVILTDKREFEFAEKYCEINDENVLILDEDYPSEASPEEQLEYARKNYDLPIDGWEAEDCIYAPIQTESEEEAKWILREARAFSDAPWVVNMDRTSDGELNYWIIAENIFYVD
jgi:hypothetical protein